MILTNIKALKLKNIRMLNILRVSFIFQVVLIEKETNRTSSMKKMTSKSKVTINFHIFCVKFTSS